MRCSSWRCLWQRDQLITLLFYCPESVENLKFSVWEGKSTIWSLVSLGWCSSFHLSICLLLYIFLGKIKIWYDLLYALNTLIACENKKHFKFFLNDETTLVQSSKLMRAHGGWGNLIPKCCLLLTLDRLADWWIW